MKRFLTFLSLVAFSSILGILSDAHSQTTSPIMGIGIGTGGVSAITVATTSTVASPAGNRSAVLFLQNVSTSNAVACSFGGIPALNTAGSFQIAAGQALAFNTSYIPQDAINCIASAPTPMTVLSR